jgi:hypothetical protein
VVYHEKWYQVARDALSYHDTWKQNLSNFPTFERYSSTGRIECQRCIFKIVDLDGYVIGLLRRLGGDSRSGLTGLRDLDATFASPESEKLCPHIAPSFAPWRSSIGKNIKKIPKLKIPVYVTHYSFYCEIDV